MKPQLLGYDIRVATSTVIEREWNATRREQYLLRPEIFCPVSVDKAVLTSVFEFDVSDTRSSSGKIVLHPADFHQQALGLWRERRDMEQKAISEKGKLGSQLLKVLAITLGEEDRVARNQYWREFFSETVVAEELDAPWEFGGFDVADRYLTSGLSNCGLGDELKALRGEWATSVNDQGLFSTLEMAVKYREFLGSRVPVHAPFCVYGIHWREMKWE